MQFFSLYCMLFQQIQRREVKSVNLFYALIMLEAALFSFSDQDPVLVAKELLGGHLVHVLPTGEPLIGKIVETGTKGSKNYEIFEHLT